MAAAGAACALLFIACWDDARDPLSPTDQPALQELVVSNAVEGAPSSVAGTALASTDSGVTYVSLAAGRFPTGVLASIRNRRSGWSATAAMIDGGLDPVEVVAQVGDTIEIDVKKAGEASLQSIIAAVPAKRRPRVVRTIPPRKKTDVPLNARLSIVFSEPMDPSTINPSTVRVLAGTSTVAGMVSAADSTGLRYDFVPSSGFVANTRHVITLGSSIQDLDGDLLEVSDEIEFTTGSAVAVASVVTEAAAMFTVVDRGPRTFTMNAVRYSDGRVAGDFMIYYADIDRRRTGRITCFTIVGNQAWAAGVSERLNGEPDPDGWEWGWRAVDNRTTPDQLSLAQTLEPGLFESASAFCAGTPLTYPNNLGEFRVNNLESGDIVIRGETPPDTTQLPPNAMSQIAYRAQASYAIHVMNADGTNIRALTSGSTDSDPAWSTDGRRLAFVRSDHAQGNYGSIFVINADRSGVQRLTVSEGDRNPAWSPDGMKIAFERNGIQIMNADGTGVTDLRNDEFAETDPAWSPDGSRIAFSSWRGGAPAIWHVKLDGTEITRVTPDSLIAASPAWSPDGNSIAFVAEGRGIFVVNPDGAGLRRLTIGGQHPSWSPDGQQIVFVDFGVTLINADGSGRRKIGNGQLPSWSRSGSVPPAPVPFLSLQVAGGNGQADTVLSTLAQPLSVRVVRDDGTPAQGVRVDWLFSGAGQPPLPRLSTYINTTDAAGIASVTMTLGAVARRSTLRAVIINGSAHSDGVEFSATARPGKPTAFQMYGGGNLGEVDSTLEYVVFAKDSHGGCNGCGNFVSGVPVTWVVTSGGGTITPREDTTAVVDPFSPYAVARAIHRLGLIEETTTVTATAPTIAGAAPIIFGSTVVTKIVSVDFGFHPDTVEVPSGRTVVWRWAHTDDSDNFHNITFEDFPTAPTSSESMGSGEGGEIFKRTFTGSPRTIRYRCTLHTTGFTAGEVGVVIVK